MERTVVFTAVAKFAQARRDADKTRESYKRLDDEVNKVNRDGAKGVGPDARQTETKTAAVNRLITRMAQLTGYTKRQAQTDQAAAQAALNRERAQERVTASVNRSAAAQARAADTVARLRAREADAANQVATAEQRLLDVKNRASPADRAAAAAKAQLITASNNVTSAIQRETAARTRGAATLAGLRAREVQATDRVTVAEQRLLEVQARKRPTESGVLAATTALNRAKATAATISEQVARAVEREAAAQVRAGDAVVTARRRLAKAQADVATAERAATGTSAAALSATAAVNRAKERAAQVAGTLAQALDRERAAQVSHTREVERGRVALAGITAATGRAGGGFNATSGALRGLGGGWGGNARGAGIFGAALRGLAIPVIASAIQELSGLLSPLAAGFFGLAGAIAPAAGLLATLPGLLAAAGGGIGTVLAGFSGIGGALKAYTQQQAATTKTAAKQETAQKKLARAEDDNADRIRQSARAIRDAKRGVADAYRNAADSARNSSRSIQQAERGVSDAQRNASDAQKAVSQARRDARQQIEDLRKSLQDLRLQEEGASLSLEEARERLIRVNNDPGSTDLERRGAALAVKQAEAALDDTRDAQKRNSTDLKEAQRKGVEGSDQVVAAKRAEADANRAVADAEDNLNEARRQASRSAQDSARAIQSAQESLSDAYRNSKKSQQDYNDKLADLKTSAVAGSAATDKFAEAMAKLTPEARAVVQQLIRMKPLIDEIRQAAQRGLLPGFLSLLKDSTALFPSVLSFVSRTARAFGDFFTRIGDGITSPNGLRMLNQILDSTYRVIKIFLGAAYDAGAAIANITVAARPLTEWLVQSVANWAKSWRAMTSGEAGQKRLVDFFDHARSTAAQLGRIISNLVGALIGLGKGTQGVGQGMLDTFERMTKGWTTFLNSIQGQNALIDWGNRSKPVLSEVQKLFGAILDAILDLGRQADLANLLAQIRTELLPALQDVITTLAGDFTSNLVSFATNLAKILTALGKTGLLSAFADALVAVSKGLAEIMQHKAVVSLISGILGVAAGYAVLVGASGAILRFGVAIRNIRRALTLVTTTFKLSAGAARVFYAALGPIGIAIGIATAAYSFFAQSNAEAKERVDDLTESLRANNGVLDEATKKERIATITKNGYYDAAKALGISVETATRAYFGEQDALDQVNKVMQDQIDAKRAGGKVTYEQATAVNKLRGTLQGEASDMAAATEQADKLRAADEASLSPTERAEKARLRLEAATEQQRTAEENLTNAIDATRAAQEAETNAVNAHRNALIQLRGGQRAVNAATRELEKAVSDNGRVFDANGNALKGMQEKADASQASLDNLASSAIDLANQMRENGATEDEVKKKLDANREQFIKNAHSMGISKEAAKKLADQLFQLPARTQTDVEIADKEAKDKLKAYRDEIAKLPPAVQTAINVKDKTAEGLERTRQAIETWKKVNPTMQQILINAGVKLNFDKDSAADLQKKAQNYLNKLSADSTPYFVKRSGGGEIHGPGTTTSDSIPALLSDREFVHNAAATDYYGVNFMHALNQRRIPKGALPGFAFGGLVSKRNRLAKGGQPSGGSYGISISAGVNTSGLQGSVQAAVSVLGPLFRVAKQVSDSITIMGSVIGNAVPKINSFAGIVKTTFARLTNYMTAPVSSAARTITSLLNSIYTTVSGWVSRAINGVRTGWTARITGLLVDPFKPVPAQIDSILGQLKTKIDGWVGQIGNAWNALRGAAARPVTFIIDTVLNGGLIAAYNGIAGALGVGRIGPITKPAGLKNGGQVPGYAAGGRIAGGKQATRDNVLGVDRKGMAVARVEPGEWVAPRWMSPMFGTLEAIRQSGRLPGYRDGGPVDDRMRKRKRERLLYGGGRGSKLTDDPNPNVPMPLRSGGSVPESKSLPLPSTIPGVPGNIKLLAAHGPSAGDDGEGASSGGAVAKGKSMIGQSGWYRRCLAFVNAAWSYSVSRFRLATARQSANAGPRSKSGTPPGGAGVYWDTGSAGHIALAVGDGTVISNDIVRAGLLSRVPQGRIGSSWGAPYMGWWHPNGAKGSAGNGMPDTGGDFDSAPIALIDYAKKFADATTGALSKIGSIEGTPIGKLAGAAARKLYKGLTDKVTKINAAQDQGVSTDGIAKASGKLITGGSNRSIGHRMLLKAGFGEGQWDPLNKLWTKESGWRTTAQNPSSGAYGIPQSLPGSKMASAGSDWRSNPATQVKWGLGYIKSRYGSPASAWAHSQRTNWYARGTNSASRGTAIVGENGPEVIHLNGGERIQNNTITRQLPGYNTGGVVRGIKPGAKGAWVQYLNSAMMNGVGNTWGGGLSRLLSASNGSLSRSFTSSNTIAARVWRLLWGSFRGKNFPDSIPWVAGKLGQDPTRMYRDDTKIMAFMRKQVAAQKDKNAKSQANSILSQYGNAHKSFGTAQLGWLKALERQVGTKPDGSYDAYTAQGTKHAIAHGMKWPVGTHGHGRFDSRPWDPVTAAEKALEEQIRANSLNAEFDRLTSQFTSWGLTYVVRKMNDLGVADGLTVGRSLAKNRAVATEYDKNLKIQYDREDVKANADSTAAKLQLLINTLAAGTTASPVGLQGAAKAISLSIDSTAALYEELSKMAGYKVLPAAKRGRFEKDVVDFRNLFKFANGGRVPGYGNGDRVPIMAEPGEMVLRRASVAALTRSFGKQAVMGLNYADRYANGGFVAGGMSTPSFTPGSITGVGAAARSTTATSKEVHNHFNTTINNPTLEDGAISVQKRVTRIARLGLLNGDDR